MSKKTRIKNESAEIGTPNVLHPRYCQRLFPSYRFVPGLNPHPIRDPLGHSYGQTIKDVGRLKEDSWYENEEYLFAVDLYNYAFWWEAHESFESLWQRIAKEDPTRDYLQGLIKISAAFLKWHLKQQRGCEILYIGGIGHLQEVLDSSTEYMGLNLMNHIAKVSIHFREVIAQPNQWPDSQIDYPFIVLKEVK